MNRVVFAYNAISRNQRGMRRIRMERVYRDVSHYKNGLSEHDYIIHIVVFSVKCSLIIKNLKIFEN